MCMITMVPQGIKTPLQGIQNGAVANDDGHGVAVFTDHGIELKKSMDSAETIDFLMTVRRKNEPFMFHSRWATAGVKDTFNVHPFWVSGNVVMAHNGVFPQRWQPKYGDSRSDTRIFVDRLDDLMRNLNRVPSRREARAIGNLIGDGNKLTFFAATEQGLKTRIVNAHAGVQRYGAWFSNYGFEYDEFWHRYGSSSFTPRTPTIASTDRATTFLKKVALRQQASYHLEEPCWQCGEATIKAVSHYCSTCKACNDCFSSEMECLCYSGKEGDPFWNTDMTEDEWQQFQAEREDIWQEETTDRFTPVGSEITLNTSAGKEVIKFEGSPTNEPLPSKSIVMSDGRAGWGE